MRSPCLSFACGPALSHVLADRQMGVAHSWPCPCPLPALSTPSAAILTPTPAGPRVAVPAAHRGHRPDAAGAHRQHRPHRPLAAAVAALHRAVHARAGVAQPSAAAAARLPGARHATARVVQRRVQEPVRGLDAQGAVGRPQDVPAGNRVQGRPLGMWGYGSGEIAWDTG